MQLDVLREQALAATGIVEAAAEVGLVINVTDQSVTGAEAVSIYAMLLVADIVLSTLA